jgi:D-serine deaminase-like pyridoxal phosphate-dependent protein
MNKREIPTPALVVDIDALDRNIERMAAVAREAGKGLRPHLKAHKCVEIARRQVAAGAVGVCAATVAEAEIMAGTGVPVLLTSPVGSLAAARRAAGSVAMAVVDHPQQVEWYASGPGLDVLVDLDIGDHRTGATIPEQALALIEAVRRKPNLRLRGVQAYAVKASHEAEPGERERLSRNAFAKVAALEKIAGVRFEIVSGGSTATAAIDARIGIVTELQAGSYALMDMAYGKMNLGFENAAHVLATVVSANHEQFVTVNAGYKSIASDRGYPPAVKCPAGAVYRWGGDEFGFVEGGRLELGDVVELVPPHCDPNLNLYDRLYACRGGEVEGVWEVAGGRR